MISCYDIIVLIKDINNAISPISINKRMIKARISRKRQYFWYIVVIPRDISSIIDTPRKKVAVDNKITPKRHTIISDTSILLYPFLINNNGNRANKRS